MVYQRSKTVLKQQGLAASKKLGQNFLVHRHRAEDIVHLAGLSKEDTVLEVGVGLGALTVPLAEAAGQVLGVEADAGLIRFHAESASLPSNVRLRHEDILQVDFKELAALCGGRLKIVANLPYSISSPFLFKALAQHQDIDFAILMLQKEVAQRLLAQPNTKEYGIPTVLLASCAAVDLLMELGPEEFHPQPKVDSAVVRLTFHPVPERVQRLGSVDYPLLKRLVNGGFGQRRKKILNGLAATGLWSKQDILTCLKDLGLSPEARAEQLTVEDFVRLSQAIKAFTSNN
jgi:16S rRNA (adenine1518-N6/adenine1519-N6)-dimethyltransferase